MSGGAIAYLAAPVDALGDNSHEDTTLCERVLAELAGGLRETGFIVFTPQEGWRCPFGGVPDPRVQRANLKVLDQADYLLAHLPSRVPTVGTVMEIERAVRRGIPTIVVGGQHSYALSSLVQVATAEFECVQTPAEALKLAAAWLETTELRTDRRKPLRFARLGSQDQPTLPGRHYEDDAGLDLYVSRTSTIRAGEFADVPSGVACELPPGTWGLLIGRSSTLRRRGLLVNPAVIDCGWRGELFAGCFNISGKMRTIAEGERLAQLIVLPVLTPDYLPVWAERLEEHPRGQSGFGSTGD